MHIITLHNINTVVQRNNLVNRSKSCAHTLLLPRQTRRLTANYCDFIVRRLRASRPTRYSSGRIYGALRPLPPPSLANTTGPKCSLKFRYDNSNINYTFYYIIIHVYQYTRCRLAQTKRHSHNNNNTIKYYKFFFIYIQSGEPSVNIPIF